MPSLITQTARGVVDALRAGDIRLAIRILNLADILATTKLRLVILRIYVACWMRCRIAVALTIFRFKMCAIHMKYHWQKFLATYWQYGWVSNKLRREMEMLSIRLSRF